LGIVAIMRLTSIDWAVSRPDTYYYAVEVSAIHPAIEGFLPPTLGGEQR
jgi:hypothetical protein